LPKSATPAQHESPWQCGNAFDGCSASVGLGQSAVVSGVASKLLAFCNMKTLYLRNVPDDVVRRLERLAAADGTSVGAVAIRELADVSRRADNPDLLGALPDRHIDVGDIVDAVAAERPTR
jgi:hypothetical protein